MRGIDCPHAAQAHASYTVKLAAANVLESPALTKLCLYFCCELVTPLFCLCFLQDPKRVVEHYAAGEGEGAAAPKVCVWHAQPGTLPVNNSHP